MKDSRFYLRKCVLTACAGFALLGFSCRTTPDEIPDDDREIVQRAQEANDSGNYKLAINYYKALLEKYGDSPNIYVEGNYEIAHIYTKKKKYEQAVPILEEILEIYNNVAPGSIPGEYKKLSQMDLAKVPQEKLDAIHAASKSSAETETETEENKTSVSDDDTSETDDTAAEE